MKLRLFSKSRNKTSRCSDFHDTKPTTFNVQNDPNSNPATRLSSKPRITRIAQLRIAQLQEIPSCRYAREGIKISARAGDRERASLYSASASSSRRKRELRHQSERARATERATATCARLRGFRNAACGIPTGERGARSRISCIAADTIDFPESRSSRTEGGGGFMAAPLGSGSGSRFFWCWNGSFTRWSSDF